MKGKFLFISIFAFCLLVVLSACGPSQEEIHIGVLRHFKRGNAMLEQKNYLKALDEYQAAIRLDDTQAIFFYNKGLVLYELRLYHQSAQAYLKAIELDKKLPEAWYNLALVYDKLEESEKAFMAYEQYQNLQKKQVP